MVIKPNLDNIEKFTDITHQIKNLILEVQTSNIDNEQNVLYIGYTIYKRTGKVNGNKWMTQYSLSVYKDNKNIVKIDENIFTGLVFDWLNEEANLSDISYISYFFPDINRDIIKSKFNTVKTIFGKNNNFAIQLIVFSRTNPTSIMNMIDLEQSILSHSMFDKIKQFPPLLKLKNINILHNKIIVIIDLIRNDGRKKEPYIESDALITHKMITDIEHIVNQYGFLTGNHTGDGFFFIYNKSKKPYKVFTQSFNNMINEIFNYLQHTKILFTSLSKVVSNYRLRVTLGICEKLFEINDNNKAIHKLYYSAYLDSLFEHNAKETRDEEYRNKEKNIFLTYDKDLLNEPYELDDKWGFKML